MNLALPLRARQGLAVGILLIAVMTLWNVVVWQVVSLPIAMQADVTALSTRLQDLRTVAHRAPTLTKREQAAVAGLQSLDVFWSGTSKSATLSAMHDLIRNAAQQSGGVVSSSSALATDEAAPHGMLGVRARVEGSLDTLQHVLTAIDAAHPKLFLGNLSVSVTVPGTRDRPPQLSFEFSVSGYFSGGQHAH